MLDWRLIPSNILKAFKKTKKQKQVNNKLNGSILNVSLLNENLISLMAKFSSKFKITIITIVNKTNFKFGDKSYLSSR